MRGLAAILFAILKWFCIVLLVIIGVILVVAICILFVPVRYHINIEKQGQFVVRGYVSWLFHFLHLSFQVKDGEESHMSRVFGIPLKRTGERKIQKEKRSDDKVVKTSKLVEAGADNSETGCQTQQENLVTRREERQSRSSGDVSRKKGYRLKFFLWWKEFFLRIRRILGKIKKGFGAFWKFLMEGPDQESNSTFMKVMTLLTDDNTLQLWRLVWRGISSLWRHSRPKKLVGWIHFGTSDPCTTGEILGAIGVGYAMIGSGVQIVPDFENAVFEGCVEMKGRIQMIRLLSVLGGVFFSSQWKHFKRQIG